mgnify:CR=1 FL=1
MTTIVKCEQCGREYVPDRKKGHRGTLCNSCVVNTRRASVKEKAVSYKGGACAICGYDRCARALGFHHKDPAKKDFPLGANYTRSWDKLKVELDKCILLCANCHAEVHDGMVELGG